MRYIYCNSNESIPDNSPEPRGGIFQLNIYVDSDHFRDKVTRKTQTIILFFINMALIYWFSKNQLTVESSTFGYEYVSLNISFERIIAI